MKQLISILVLFLSISYNTYGQINQQALGIRGGRGNYGNGGELSYQHSLGEENRIEADLGLRIEDNHSHFIITGIYHWVWAIENNFNWYFGPGAQIGSWSDKNFVNENGLTIALGGQIGLEFDFQDLGAPLLLSLDTRPMIGFVGGNSGFGYGAAFGLRYIFD